MSEANLELNPQQPAPTQSPILLNTKLEFLNQRFYFHDILKDSGLNKHFIVEDLEFDSSIHGAGAFFYLKQSIFTNKGEYQYALKYYQKLLTYCKMPFAKTDIIRLHQIHNFDLEESNYFELVLIFDLGEPDRIDIDNIESQHITKFLKNVCLLLQDLKKYDQIYHGNIYIKNIVLVNTELKLSGFKPIYTDNQEYQTWKVQLAKRYNHFRSDLYLIGLIWLRFLGANVEEATDLSLSLDQVVSNIDNILAQLPEEKKMNIVLRLLDLKNNDELTLDDIILEFDEFYILENIRNVEEEKRRLAESGEINSENNPAFNLNNSRSSSVDHHHFDSYGAPLKKSDSKDTNPFMKPYKESERDIMALRGLADEHHTNESKNNPDFLKIDGEFTLKDDEDSILPERNSRDELITIQDVKREHALTLQEGADKIDTGKRHESSGIPKILSEKMLGLDGLEEERNSMRKLKSTDVLLTEPNSKSSVNRKQTQKGGPSKNSEAKLEEKPKSNSKNKKKVVKVSSPAPASNKISQFNKNSKKDKPGVYQIEEDKPSSSQILREKRAQLQGLKEEVELTPEQRVKIQKAVEKELERRTQADAERLEKQKEGVEKLAQENKAQSSSIQEKIDKISKEKLQKKKEELRNELKARKEQNEAVDQEYLQKYIRKCEKEERHKNNRDLSPVLNKTFLHNVLPSALQETDKDFVNVASQYQSQALPLKKTTNSIFNDINHKAKRDFQVANTLKREKLFTYNRELEVKQIPFRRLAENQDKFQKVEPKKNTPHLDSLFKTLDIDRVKEKTGELKASDTEEKLDVQAPLPSKVQSQSPLKDNNIDPSPLSVSSLPKTPKAEPTSPSQRSVNKSQKLPQEGPLPRQTLLDTLCNQPEFNNLDSSLLDNKLFSKTVEQVNSLSNALKYNDALGVLISAKDSFQNNRRVEIMKMTAAIYLKLGQSAKSKEVLLETLEYMLPNNEIENKEEIFKSVVMNLVMIAIEGENYEEAVSLLKNKVFDDRSKLPKNYLSLLGECHLKLGQYKEALAVFEEQLAFLLERQISMEIIVPLFNLINKIILTYHSLNDQVAIAKFYSRMVGVLGNIKLVNASLNLSTNDFENLLEHLSLNVLSFAFNRQNYNLVNYVLNEVVGKKLLNCVDNMNEGERVQLCDYIVNFCNYLKKLPNYGGFKANFIKYLDYAKGIIKNCDLNTKNLKTNLTIMFNRGIFQLQEKNYAKAEKLFDKCLEVYYAFFNEPDRELYAILYNIGYNLYRGGKYPQSVYFFNKMLDLNCSDATLKEKATKYLGKVYYRIGEFAKCRDTLQSFVDEHFEGKAVINYYRYLSLYFLALDKLKSEKFGEYIRRLQTELAGRPDVEAHNYLSLYLAANAIMKNHHNYKENDKFVTLLTDLAADKSGDKAAKAVRLVNHLALIHQKYVSEKLEQKGQLAIILVQSLRDKWLTVAENAEMAKDFLLNLMTLIVNKLPMFNERVKNHQYRQELLDNVRNAISKESMNKYINELFQSIDESKVDLVSANLKTQTQPLAKTSPQKINKITSEPENGLPQNEYENNPELARLIESFLKQIKNMLFLDVSENCEAYYLRFEDALKEKGYSVEKYSYIKNLIRFHLLRRGYQKLDRLKFTKLLDELIEQGNLTQRDFELIVLILESFKDVEYLHILVIYLDTYHPDFAQLIFQRIFLGIFEKKYSKVIAALYKKVHAFRFYQLENFPLMHYLESQNFINIEKELQHKIFIRLRYDTLNNEKLHKVFAKYLDPNDLQMFYVKYCTFVCLVSAVKKENVTSLDILRAFFKSLTKAVALYQIDEIHTRHYVYDFNVLIHLMNFSPEEDLTEQIFQILAYFEDRLPQSLYYHFSVLCSSVGNLFFKNHLNAAAIKAKTSALDLLSKAQDSDIEVPQYVINEDPETHLLQILSFLYIIQMEANDLPRAKEFLDQIDSMNIEFALNQLVRYFLKALYFNETDFPKKARTELQAADDLFAKMNIRDNLQDIYRAAIDKVWYLVSAKLELPEEVAGRARKSEGSISHLYRPLI